MALDRVLGVHPRHHARSIFYNKDDKMASELLYTQANCVVGYHNKLQKQRLLLDATIGDINQLLVTKGAAITIS
jgi:hypothetical protein